MVHGTLMVNRHKYRGYKCTTTVPEYFNSAQNWYRSGTLQFSTSKGIETNVPSTTISKTMKLLEYCKKNNINLVLPVQEETGISTDFNYPEIIEKWDIGELENYFATYEIPPAPLQLDRCTTITDIRLFISSHLATIKAHNGNPGYLPYYDRLVSFREKIESINH